MVPTQLNYDTKFSFDLRLIIFNYFTAITDLKKAFQNLEVRVSALEGKSPSVSINRT